MDFLKRTSGMSGGAITSGGIIGAAAILGGGILVIWTLQEKKKPEFSEQPKHMEFQYPKEGYVDAEIIGITRNLRSAGAKEGFHVICRYIDPGSGTEMTYTSDLLPEYPGKEIIGKHVRVFLDPGEMEHYQVDLTTIH